MVEIIPVFHYGELKRKKKCASTRQRTDERQVVSADGQAMSDVETARVRLYIGILTCTCACIHTRQFGSRDSFIGIYKSILPKRSYHGLELQIILP